MQRFRIVNLTVLLLAFAEAGVAKDRIESSLEAHPWRDQMLVLARADGSHVQLLVADGPYEPCGLSATDGGGAALVKRAGQPQQYGCWRMVEREWDTSRWVDVELSSGVSFMEPLTSLKKKPYVSLVGSSDFQSEQIYQDLVQRISKHFAEVNHRTRVVSALAPSFNEQEKMNAGTCLSEALVKLQKYMHVMELINSEHVRHANKWSAREMSSMDLVEKQADAQVVLDMAKALVERTKLLHYETTGCLRAKQVPFQ